MGPCYLSAFSGVGGADIGLAAAGWRCVGACEIDQWRRGVFMRHHPNVPVGTDIREWQTDERPLLLWGSPPCQDFSVAGRRVGISGGRGALMWEFIRVADEVVQPGRWIALEQVPGLLSSHGGRDFAAILGALADIGFRDLAYRILDSQFFGVPQRRRRVFIVARRAGGERAAEVLDLADGGSRDIAARQEARTGAAGSVAYGAGSARRLARHGAARPDAGTEDFVVVSALTKSGVGAGGGPDDNAAQAGHLVPIGLHTTQYKIQERQVASTVTSKLAKCSGGPSGDEHHNLVADSSGIRRLTPRECERLQGWPDDYTRWDINGRESSDAKRYAAIGDGVTAPVAEWIGRRLRDVTMRG